MIPCILAASRNVSHHCRFSLLGVVPPAGHGLLITLHGKYQPQHCNCSQDGTAEFDFLRGVVVQANGSILLAGGTEGDWVGKNPGGNDFVMVALSADGEELWRWQVTDSLPVFVRSRTLSCFPFVRICAVVVYMIKIWTHENQSESIWF